MICGTLPAKADQEKKPEKILATLMNLSFLVGKSFEYGEAAVEKE